VSGVDTADPSRLLGNWQAECDSAELYAALARLERDADRRNVYHRRGRSCEEMPVNISEICKRNPVTIRETEDLVAAARLMRERRIGARRMPVVGAVGQLVGVLSLDDVLDALAEELHGVVGSIRSELRMEAALRP
jgi:predicted transcriptional regulator